LQPLRADAARAAKINVMNAFMETPSS
jgi:hypothetical protein